eukprot:1138991-Pelagomonas_calceolata.AAC.4
MPQGIHGTTWKRNVVPPHGLTISHVWLHLLTLLTCSVKQTMTSMAHAVQCSPLLSPPFAPYISVMDIMLVGLFGGKTPKLLKQACHASLPHLLVNTACILHGLPHHGRMHPYPPSHLFHRTP